MERFDNPDKFLHDAWHLLIKAAIKRKGDYQKPSVATIDTDGFARQRVIVLREVDLQNRQLTFFTDARSPKVGDLRNHPYLSCLFWDERKKVQIRMNGKAILEQGSESCRQYWDRLPVQGRSSYASLNAPGTPQVTDKVTLPDHWHDEMDLQETAYAFEHFMVIRSQVYRADLLHLHHEGHQRAKFSYQDGAWAGSWVAP
ncbi:pyridoxamine 5'-phosphate oxidase family protein [Phaeodactylibacter xiamenensis]|jgi:pyridoxine/pyridoxamine 5'-phosphate oxidase|uniref:pyridoxamine 5'-phosphate oxidase family protein n=1 Tax=Phaeodactylibacter xiamenensis TaxID=1524460 RepID=UPI0024A8E7F4|nr:pyridoxamine 5'-phosphate oxidase family protein [Phaeodactylibacter xiamenensis]